MEQSAGALADGRLAAGLDENQASASARSARASLLHRWEDSSDAVAIKRHAESSDVGRASLSDVASADHASIRGSGARSAGRRRVSSGCGADGSCAARRTVVPPPAHAAESRAVVCRRPVGAAAGHHRFHASATARDGTCRGHSRDRRSQSENCDLVAERQGNRRAAPPRPPSGSPWPPTKRQMTPAVCRNAGETGAKSGKTRTPYRWPEARDSLQRASFRHDGRTTENRGVPGSSPGLAIKTLLQIRGFAALCQACETAGNGRWPFRDQRLRGKCPAATGLHEPRSTRCVSCADAAALGGSQLRSDR